MAGSRGVRRSRDARTTPSNGLTSGVRGMVSGTNPAHLRGFAHAEVLGRRRDARRPVDQRVETVLRSLGTPERRRPPRWFNGAVKHADGGEVGLARRLGSVAAPPRTGARAERCTRPRRCLFNPVASTPDVSIRSVQAVSFNKLPLSSGWLIVDELPMFHRFAAGPGGRAETVVHVHGLAISGTYLESTAARLAARWRTYVPDLPGMGRSLAAADTSDVGGLARSLASYCTAAQIEQATFVANSLGCSIVIELAHLVPDMVCRAVLVSPVGSPHNRPLIRLVSQAARDARHERPSLLPIAMRDYLRCGVVRSWSMLRAMVRYPVADRLSKSTMPTLLVVGRRDPLVRFSWAEALTISPHVQAVEVDGPHALNYSAPDRMANVIAEFIEHGDDNRDKPVGVADSNQRPSRCRE